jgi:hypothetical protein
MLTNVYFKGNAPTVASDAFSGDSGATVYNLPGTTRWVRRPLNNVNHKLSKLIMHLQKALSIAFLMTFYGMACCGGTNDIAGPAIRFSLPPMRLRAEPRPNLAKPDETVSAQPTSSASVGSSTLENVLSDSDLHSSVVRSDEFYLTRPEAPSDSGLLRYVDRLFTPEVVRIGRASVSCPFVTVIKRKNPLCLLSGFGTDRTLISYIFLQVSW